MFYNLPRHMFGQVQSRLFPMFYLWSLIASAVSIATYVTLHPFESWDRSDLVQVREATCWRCVSLALSTL